MVHIKIIRHSERLDFTYPLYWLVCFGHYWSDSPLTNNGYLIANNKGKELINDFNPSFIYTSPYTRTMATATEISKSFPKTEIIIEPLLSEYQPYYNHKINLYPTGIPTTYNGVNTDFSYPETYESFSKRALFIINKILQKHPNQDIIFITHGEFLKFYLNHFKSLYPKLKINSDYIPYLSTLSFDYDETNSIIESSIIFN